MTDTRELVRRLLEKDKPLMQQHGNWLSIRAVIREAADALEAHAEENRRLQEALALLTVRAGSLVFAHHHGNGLEGWHKVIEGVDCALTQARIALSSTGEKV